MISNKQLYVLCTTECMLDLCGRTAIGFLEQADKRVRGQSMFLSITEEEVAIPELERTDISRSIKGCRQPRDPTTKTSVH